MIVLCIDSTKPFLLSTLVELTQIISGIGILFAAGTYYFNRKLKRAEWLKSLFEKFYENDHYKNVRRWLDFDEIEKELSEDKDHIKEEQVSDFLNFFEFIAVLENQGQIKLKEIINMFSYYLGIINNSGFCKKYIQENRYKNLQKLLDKFTNRILGNIFRRMATKICKFFQ